MSIETTSKEAIKIRKNKIKEKEREIFELKEQIEKIKKNPKMFVSLEAIMKETQQALKESDSPKMRLRHLVLRNLMSSLGTIPRYETLFQVSEATENVILRRAGFGKKKLQELKNLLAEYDFTLTKE